MVLQKLLQLAVLAAAGASPPLEPLSAGAVSCTSVILRWPAATGRQPPVLEFAVWMRPATASPPPFTRYSTAPLGGTQTEVSELEAGSSFEFEVRARSVDGWAKYTAPLRGGRWCPTTSRCRCSRRR